VTVNLGTGSATSTAGVSGIQDVVGTSGNDAITAGAIGGTLTGNGGSDTLFGGSGPDTFVVGPTQAASTTIDGGSGSNTLVAANIVNSWNITGANSGSLNAIAFANVQRLMGGTAADTFTSGTSGNVSGSIVGGGGLDSLVAANGSNAWNITAGNTGSLNGIAFSGIANLTGGTSNDVFSFGSAGFVGGAVNGGGGNDVLNFSSRSAGAVVNLQTGAATAVGAGISNIEIVHGGSGADTLTGNATGNVLIGGGGADTISGGNGRSVLIGRNGNDKIKGGNADDIIIGGSTDFDANYTALASILAEWQSNNPYTTRISHLKGNSSGGLNGGNILTFGGTVHDDGTTTSLTGGAGSDWFFTGANSSITDRQAGEQVN